MTGLLPAANPAASLERLRSEARRRFNANRAAERRVVPSPSPRYDELFVPDRRPFVVFLLATVGCAFIATVCGILSAAGVPDTFFAAWCWSTFAFMFLLGTAAEYQDPSHYRRRDGRPL